MLVEAADLFCSVCWLSGILFFCFLVKCVEAGWPLEISFHGFFLYGCYLLDTDIAISDVQNLSFGRLGAATLAPWEPFWPLGVTLGDHVSSRKDTSASRL